MRKKTFFASVILMVVVLYSNVQATDVGGIINSDTTWSLAGSPYNVTSIVQVADGVTLTIEPGAEVFGNHFQFQVWGTLDVMGTEQLRISLNDMRIISLTVADVPAGIISIAFCRIDSVQISTWGASLTLKDSILQNSYSSTILLYNVYGDWYIERNIFIGTAEIFLYMMQDANVYIYNNVFFEQNSGTAIRNDGANPIVKYNSFLSTDRIAIELDGGGSMTAAENFWNTTDTAVIDSMIYDRNDNLNIDNYVSYLPFLTEPDPNTPIFHPDQTLTIQTQPSLVTSVTPTVGQSIVSGLVDIGADKYINCPDVYQFDRWEGDVDDPNSASTTVFMDSDKTVTAVFNPTRNCGDECHPNNLFGDYNNDCIIDIEDFAQFALNWMVCTKPECD